MQSELDFCSPTLIPSFIIYFYQTLTTDPTSYIIDIFDNIPASRQIYQNWFDNIPASRHIYRIYIGNTRQGVKYIKMAAILRMLKKYYF